MKSHSLLILSILISTLSTSSFAAPIRIVAGLAAGCKLCSLPAIAADGGLLHLPLPPKMGRIDLFLSSAAWMWRLNGHRPLK